MKAREEIIKESSESKKEGGVCDESQNLKRVKVNVKLKNEEEYSNELKYRNNQSLEDFSIKVKSKKIKYKEYNKDKTYIINESNVNKKYDNTGMEEINEKNKEYEYNNKADELINQINESNDSNLSENKCNENIEDFRELNNMYIKEYKIRDKKMIDNISNSDYKYKKKNIKEYKYFKEKEKMSKSKIYKRKENIIKNEINDKIFNYEYKKDPIILNENNSFLNCNIKNEKYEISYLNNNKEKILNLYELYKEKNNILLETSNMIISYLN